MQIGLGTDVSGGYSPSMLSAVRNAVVASKALRMQSISKGLSLKEADKDLLNWKEALYLATQGGAQALGIQVKFNIFLSYYLILRGRTQGAEVSLFQGQCI